MTKHFIITALGTSGDVLPFVEIGKYLLSRNHKVSFITNPYYEGLVRNSGLVFIPFGSAEQYQEALDDPTMWHPKDAFALLWRKTIQPNMHGVRWYVQALDPAEEVVILCHPAMMAVANLARAAREDLKVVLFYLSPAIIRTHFGRRAFGDKMVLPRNTPRILRKALDVVIDKTVFDAAIVPDLNRERIKVGLPPIKHFLQHIQSSADLYVTLFPEWYASTKPDYPRPLVNGNFLAVSSPEDRLSDQLQEFLDGGSAPVLFTPGTGNLHARKFFEIATDVVRQLNIRAIFLTRFREQLPGDLPGSVLWQEYVPLEKILHAVSTIVHHGGIGTVAEACRAGVPQLIVPFAYDQFDNALIVNELGIGRSCPARLLTRERLGSGLLEIQRSKDIKSECMKVSSNYRAGLEIGQILDKVLSEVGRSWREKQPQIVSEVWRELTWKHI